MKSALITPIGHSPPIATELLSFLEIFGNPISDLILISTKDIYVLEGCILIQTALSIHHPHVHTHRLDFPFEDIKCTEDNIEFMQFCAMTIKEEREIHNCERIYLNIAGGRKDMSASLALLAQFVPIDGIYHIITPDIKVFNEKLERMRGKIHELANSENKIEFYNNYKDDFNTLLFPPIESFNVIRIPVLPYPKKYLESVMMILRAEDNPIPHEDISLSEEEIQSLEYAGLINISSYGIYPSDYGKLVSKLFGRKNI